MTIPGIGSHTALALTSYIEDVNRFETPEKLAAYFGLVPSQHQSGNKNYYGGITKAGNP